MRVHLILLALLLMMTASADAQRKKKSPRTREPEPTQEELERKEKMDRMIANTAQVLFIDSFVVNKKDFLSRYMLNPEAGTIDTYQHMYNTDRQPNAYVNLNEIGNRCYLSQENNEGIINLYTSEKVGNKWTRPTKIRGINDQKQFQRVNYPYIMGDGETLYFAAEGPDGVGGYDIYTSSYDKESKRFLQPVNMGMPFNSEANDYMFVIDEYSNTGWFASDRNQPEDTVCVYVFQPYEFRKTYDPEEYTPEQIASFARISSISDTWGDRQQLGKAVARLQMTRDRNRQQVKGRDFTFVINDELTYYHLSDFKVSKNVERYHELSTLRARYGKLTRALQHARDYYPTANKDEIDELRTQILASEKKQLELYQQIRTTEKTIRNEENLYLTNKQ